MNLRNADVRQPIVMPNMFCVHLVSFEGRVEVEKGSRGERNRAVGGVAGFEGSRYGRSR